MCWVHGYVNGKKCFCYFEHTLLLPSTLPCLSVWGDSVLPTILTPLINCFSLHRPTVPVLIQLYAWQNVKSEMYWEVVQLLVYFQAKINKSEFFN